LAAVLVLFARLAVQADEVAMAISLTAARVLVEVLQPLEPVEEAEVFAPLVATL
jgi:hypothetical protein